MKSSRFTRLICNLLTVLIVSGFGYAFFDKEISPELILIVGFIATWMTEDPKGDKA